MNKWKVEKLGYRSHFNPEYNTERGFIGSLSIALGFLEIKEFQNLSIQLWATAATAPKQT